MHSEVEYKAGGKTTRLHFAICVIEGFSGGWVLTLCRNKYTHNVKIMKQVKADLY